MVTGNGLKDIDGIMKAIKNKAITVENSIEDVTKKLNILL